MAIFGPSDMIWRTSDMVPANDARPERTPARAAVPPNFEGEDEHQADLDDLADPTVQLYSSSQCSEGGLGRTGEKEKCRHCQHCHQSGGRLRWWEFQRARGHGTLTERTTTRWRFPRC